MRITVRYFAGARAAAGEEERVLELPLGATVRDALSAIRADAPTGLPRVLESASYLVNGVAVRDQGVALNEGAELDVLPPFAGG
ncbi:molybdopterin converting factor small subunit [Tamaricihabitans halophyticus]|uniref:Molybdopterin synthase sulfur carrier subunit n=1 Tax=Tamaricihabitans halophyticus TaxID=1262583 RepID=A0A4R2R1K0_9PSEU|nr:MoaD/ThiS family protein [Tamaricihabitans halophyticus]TCP56570.1 molybdopterin converting factor small subunit [Tamaricihabitans halophyticus]